MPLSKLGFLVLLAAVVAQAQLGTSRTPTRQSEPQSITVAVPNSQSRGARASSPPALVPVQSKNPDQLGVGKLLVASRSLGDPHFMKTVVLLVQYDAGGVVGLILNRRTDLPISEVLEGVKGAKSRSDLVYAGGPVDPQVILGLRKSTAKLYFAKQICDQVYQIAGKAELEKIISEKTPANAVHLYLGYAGWNVEQLKNEMKLGAWFVFPADAETVFNADPESLWPEMIRKTELQFARKEGAELK